MSLKIYECFTSLQGESTHAGKLCFFIRLAGCPLRCSYCDTRKAQDPAAGVERSEDELLEFACGSGSGLVEVTGGEPLAQKETPELCAALLAAGFRVLVETNGAFDCSVLPEGVIRILDFKTPSSGESGRMYLPNYRKLRKSDEVKFVIGDEADYHFSVKKIREFRMAEQTENLLFSPVYGTISLPFLAERMIADRVPARLNLQLHKIVWGPEREGV